MRIIHFVNCPVCINGTAELDDIDDDLKHLSVKCEDCKKIIRIGLRDWEIDGDAEIEDD